MGYALFAQQKISLTGQCNSISLQQTQRSNEQNILASDTLSLQQQLSSMQASQAVELAEFYELLSHIKDDGQYDDSFVKSFKPTKDENGKTVEAQRNVEDYSEDAQQFLKGIENGKKNDKATRDNINSKIKEKQSLFDAELADINNEIYKTGIKENAIEMEVKRLDTALTSVQKRLDAIIEAEGSAIEKSTPKFQGMG